MSKIFVYCLLTKFSSAVVETISVLYFLIQVLRLVHYLVKFGYFGDLVDIKILLGPLLSLLDGRNDKPYPNVNSQYQIMQNFILYFRIDYVKFIISK